MIPEIDKDNMHSAIHDFPDHINAAMKIGEGLTFRQSYSDIRNIVIAGMGGSAIGGDVNRALIGQNISVPMVVSRHYTLPGWVDEHTLVICSSYSGNTEETLATYADAMAKKAQIVGVTTGGKLESLVKENDQDYVTIPKGLQPRAALGFSFVPSLYILKALGLVTFHFEDELSRIITLLVKDRELFGLESSENPAYQNAKSLYQSLPVIYGQTDWTSIAAMRFKGQLCENANMLAYHNDLPEFNHNEIVGWENNASILQQIIVIWLKDSSDYNRVKIRQEITQRILNGLPMQQLVIEGKGETPFQRFLYMVHYLDWISYWCAIFHQTDPTPVLKINLLKDELAKRK